MLLIRVMIIVTAVLMAAAGIGVFNMVTGWYSRKKSEGVKK